MNLSILRLFRFSIYALCFVFGAGLLGAVTVYAALVGVSSPLSQAADTPGGIRLLSTPTTITLESSPNPAVVGQTITFIATVSPAPDGGTVAFKASGVDITGCEARPLTGGQATCASAALAAGVQPITAAYSGNAAYDASTSAGLYQGVYVRPAVSTGWYHTCEPKPDGTLACWGANNEGQITVPAPNADWVQVSAYGYHTCGMKADGALACWGRNSEGKTTCSARMGIGCRLARVLYTPAG